MEDDIEDIGDRIHSALMIELLAKINSGDATGQELSVARQFLKDNGIDIGSRRKMKPLVEAVSEALPFELTDEMTQEYGGH
tara:strand:+ start:554 stop:796 length:243 start_codon:yes stop_codon:yes gene_type:complete